MPRLCIVGSLVSMNKVNRSVRMLGLFAALLCLVLVSPNSSSATNLNVSLTCSFAQCPDSEFYWCCTAAAPIFAFANFDPVEPGWSIHLITAHPIAWCDENSSHGLDCGGPGLAQSLYGVGGSVSMTAPDNLTFSGIVTGGFAACYNYCDIEIGDFNFFGQWSNGLFATGQNDYEFGDRGNLAFLDTSIVPEPGSLVILGTGIIGAGFAIRRRIMA